MTKIIRLNDTAYDEDILENLGVDFAVYDYTAESYEGYGRCLLCKKEKWYIHDMGHCSCCGPFEELVLLSPYDTILEATDALRDGDWSKSFDKSIETMKQMAFKWKFADLSDYWYLNERINNIEKRLKDLEDISG